VAARLTLIVLSAPAQGSRFHLRTDLSGVVALGLIQPLHGITFALLHLACMR
jgi:PPP family 3-phenylpropionic acid transporter